MSSGRSFSSTSTQRGLLPRAGFCRMGFSTSSGCTRGGKTTNYGEDKAWHRGSRFAQSVSMGLLQNAGLCCRSRSQLRVATASQETS
jgi:hypothetical protein